MKRIVIGDPVIEWVAKRTNEFGNFGAAQGIGIECDGQLIAGVAYNNFNGSSMCMHVAAQPGSRWLNRYFLYCFFDYPFNRAKVNIVIGLVGEKNELSQKLAEGVGFKFHNEIQGAHPDGALLIYTMRKEACRWLHLQAPKFNLSRPSESALKMTNSGSRNSVILCDDMVNA